MRMWETAFRTGTRIQEESARRFTGLLPPWPTQPELLFTEAIQTAQKSMEEAMRVVNESTRRNLDVVEKGLEAGRAENAGEGQAKAREVWEASLGAIRANTQTIVEVNTRVLQSWAELGKRLGESMANGRA
jgi:hypothetical protein